MSRQDDVILMLQDAIEAVRAMRGGDEIAELQRHIIRVEKERDAYLAKLKELMAASISVVDQLRKLADGG